MYRKIKTRYTCSILFMLMITIVLFPSFAQSLRVPRDSVGFCWDGKQMDRLIRFLDSSETAAFSYPSPIVAISPHDDYLYAGRMYFPLFRNFRSKEVVIFGVTHGTVRREIGDPKNKIILDSFDEWYAPYGNIRPSQLREFIRQRLDTSMFLVSNKAQQLEHSIEALLPFVQHYNPGIRITPIMVTAMSFERMDSIATALAPIIEDYIRTNRLALGKDIAFLCSSDANHYGRDFNNLPFGEDEAAHAKATQQDVRVATSYLTGVVSSEKIKSLTRELQSILWCGKYSIPFGMLASMKIVHDLIGKNITGKLYRYSDTYSGAALPIHDTGMGVTAVFSLQHWVGFFSAGYDVIDSFAH